MEGVGKCVGVWGVWKSMGSRSEEMCLGCGRSVKRVLGWGQCEGRWGRRGSEGRNVGQLREQASVGRVVSQYWTPTLLTHPPPDPTP